MTSHSPQAYYTLESDEEGDTANVNSPYPMNGNVSANRTRMSTLRPKTTKNPSPRPNTPQTLTPVGAAYITVNGPNKNYPSEMREVAGPSQSLSVNTNRDTPSLHSPSSRRSPMSKRTSPRTGRSGNGLDRDEEDAIVRQIEDNPYRSHHLSEESHTEKLWKRNLYLLLEDPSSSRLAFAVNIGLACLILFSVVLTTIETIPAIRELRWRIWFDLELGIVFLFTIELLLRAAAHSGTLKHLKKFFLAPLTILDIVAIVPFYAMIALSRDLSVEFRFTILRVFRLFRLFRAYKYTSLLQLSIEVMLIAVRQSLDALGALFFFMIMTILLFSTFLYFAERGAWDDARRAFVMSDKSVSEFDSIPAAFWFVVATITTTGYGDIVPTTFLGKLIAFPLMIMGILLIALPSVIVGRNFTVVWEVVKHRRKSTGVDELAQPPFSPTSPQHDLPTDTRPSFSQMMKTIELELEHDGAPPSTDQDLRRRILHLQTQQDLLANQLNTIHEASLHTHTLLSKLTAALESSFPS